MAVDESTLGFIKADLERKITFANPAAERMLGVRWYPGMRLDEFLVDEESRETLDTQLARRQQGMVGNYRVNIKRRSDGAVIPVDVTGLPDEDAKGRIVGSLGLFRSLERQQLVNELHTLNRSSESCNDLLVSVAQRVKQVIPFDVMTVTRYSEDQGHAHIFFVWGLAGALRAGRRWIPVNQSQLEWVAAPGAKIIPDLPKLLEDDLWASMRDEPFVKSLLDAACRSVLVRPAYRPRRLVGVISLVSRTPGNFNAEHKEIIEELPLDATMVNALEYSETQRFERQLALVRALNGCTSIKTAADKLVEQLVQTYGWSHVAVFRVEDPARKIVLVTQHSSDPDLRLDKGYAQGIDEGILGRVVREAQPIYIESVRDSPGYLRPPGWPKGDGSELCCPILLKDDKTPRWIVNVEDKLPGAFSTEEVKELAAIAAEAASVMQRISQFYFLTQSFDHTSDPIFVTDERLEIRKANRAAAELLRRKAPKEVKGDLAGLFKGFDVRAHVRRNGPADLGELALTVREADKEGGIQIPVYLSYEAFREGLGGYVFVAKDMRHIRREVELQLFKKAAYEVAVEVNSPLSLAIAGVERVVADDKHTNTLDSVRRQLYRVRRAYTKLAMFNPDARPSAANFTSIRLDAELDAILLNMPAEESALVQVIQSNGLPSIKGDPFQIGFTLETLLSLLIRSAPENDAARVEFGAHDGKVELRMTGYLPDTSVDSTFTGSSARIQADLQIAEPLLNDFLANHGGTLRRNALGNHRHQFVLRFPAVSP